MASKSLANDQPQAERARQTTAVEDIKTLVCTLPYNAYMLFMVEMVWSVGFWVPVIPFYVACLSASEQWVAWLQAIQQVGIAIAGWLWGAAADVLGADQAMLLSTALCSALLLLSGAMTDNLWAFALCRCAVGLCSKQAAVNAYIFQTVPLHLHDLAMVFRQLCNTAALLVSALLVDYAELAGEELFSARCGGYIAVFASPGAVLVPLLVLSAVIIVRDRRKCQLKAGPATRSDVAETVGAVDAASAAFRSLLRNPVYLAVLLAMLAIGFVGSAFNVAFTNLQHDLWKSPLREVAHVSAALFLGQGLMAMTAFRPALRSLGEERMLAGIFYWSTLAMFLFLVGLKLQYQGLAVLSYVLGMAMLVQGITLGSLLSKKLAVIANPRCSGQAVGTAYGCIMVAAAGSCLCVGQLYEINPEVPFYVCLGLLALVTIVLTVVLTQANRKVARADLRESLLESSAT